MSPLEARVAQAREDTAGTDGAERVRLLAAYEEAYAALCSVRLLPDHVITTIEIDAINRAPMLPVFDQEVARWAARDIPADRIAVARSAAITARDSLDHVARGRADMAAERRRDLIDAIEAYIPAMLASRVASGAYSDAADTCCAIGEEVRRRVADLESRLGELATACGGAE